MQGRSVSAGELRLVGSRLLAFFGQHEHRKLMLTSAQLEILDAFCGPDHLRARARFARDFAAARELERELEDLRARVGARDRDLDFLEFEIEEIENVAPTPEEEADLERERARLGAVESLRAAAATAAEALDPVDEGGGAVSRMAAAGAELDRVAGTDDALDALGSRFGSLTFELQDVAGELRGYLDTLEADPERLAAVEERLDQLGRLKRKHGGTVAAVLEHAERCRTERDRLAGAEETTSRLEQELAAARDALHAAAARLHDERLHASRDLAQRVVAELGELALAGATFEVVISERELTPAGSDAVEFLIGPNPGVPAGPLRETASGGELSRIMLALMSVATAEGSATVVFDEVDAGVGGTTARAVGERLRGLAGDRQVLCITHLPQVASLAERHFRVVKRPQLRDAADPEVARTEVERLDRKELVEELCRMLGSDGGDEAARRHAENLLRAA
jgi:DNA repair protein RecN (Recombination protein N)